MFRTILMLMLALMFMGCASITPILDAACRAVVGGSEAEAACDGLQSLIGPDANDGDDTPVEEE